MTQLLDAAEALMRIMLAIAVIAPVSWAVSDKLLARMEGKDK